MEESSLENTRKTIYFQPDDPIFIPEDDIPLVILFGPTGCGRTSLLVKISEYLEENKYFVEPDEEFRCSEDLKHKENCNYFRHLRENYYNPCLSGGIEYMLLLASDKHHLPVCRIMELPGDYLYDPRLRQYVNIANQHDTPIRNLTNNVFQLPCKRLWIFMLDPKNWHLDDSTYIWYMDWIIDLIYPDKMMCLGDETDLPTAKSVLNHYSFNFPFIRNPKDSTSTKELWITILRLLQHPQMHYEKILKSWLFCSSKV